MFNEEPSLPWGEPSSLPLHLVNLISCSGNSMSTSTRTISTATSNESTASKLPAYGSSLSHPMKIERADQDAEATMISSNCLNLVSLGLGDQLGDGSSLSLSSSSLFTNCPSLSSLTASIESCDTKDESVISKQKLSYQPDVRRIGGGKLLPGRNLGITDAGKLVQLRLVETGQLHPNLLTSTSQISSPSPSLSVSSPASPDTQQCSSTTHTSTISQGSIKDEDDCPKRSCLVCGDVASGFHYGVSSCEACKAFFKRTIQGNIDYTCPVANNCEINKRRRKACQACRYQKCLRQGMLKEGVRLDRVRGGRQKYRRYPMDTSHGSVQTNRKITLEENKVLESLSQCEPEQLVSLADPSLPSSALKTVSTLSDIYDRELVGTIGWAKQVPGFTDLTLNDQMKLLQSSWTEVLTLTLVYRSLPKLGKLNFASDFSLNEGEATECGLEHFFEKCMLIVERMERLGITREEFLILKALVIANSDCQLEEFAAIGRLRENLLSSLHDAVYFIRCGDANLHLQSLLLILPSLRDADTVLRMFWSQIKQEGQVPMNKLLIEMLEA
eukprot:GFUD01003121.1.p1 GENE.GFUD01003121.1~~GFUD01003121.1.p1  ORF type:complete len:557 (+),score=98.07 GFUD01003121.1:117-1787(+)